MKWLTLYNKIGKQNLSKIKGQDVYAIIDNKEVLMVLKSKVDGTLYLTPKKQKGVYKMEKNKMQRLEELEKEFREVGYTEDAIKAIEKADGAIEIADFINNLESEKSYWGE